MLPFFYISTSIKIEINSILVIPNCPRIPTKKYLTSADFFIKNNFHKILLLIFSDFWFFFVFLRWRIKFTESILYLLIRRIYMIIMIIFIVIISYPKQLSLIGEKIEKDKTNFYGNKFLLLFYSRLFFNSNQFLWKGVKFSYIWTNIYIKVIRIYLAFYLE